MFFEASEDFIGHKLNFLLLFCNKPGNLEKGFLANVAFAKFNYSYNIDL
jgi:hypothetical protein